MRPRTGVLVAVLAAALGLNACGGDTGGDTEDSSKVDDTSQVNPTGPAGGPGDYTLTTETGTTYTARVPADPSDPLLSDVERCRKAAGAPPFNYVVMEIDNTTGETEAASLEAAVTLVSAADGESTLFPHIAIMDGVLEAHVTDNLPRSERDACWAYYSGFYDQQQVLPGAKESVILATTDPVDPNAISRVFLTPEQYGEQVELTQGG